MRGCPGNRNVDKTFVAHVGPLRHARLTLITNFIHFIPHTQSKLTRAKTTVFNKTYIATQEAEY